MELYLIGLFFLARDAENKTTYTVQTIIIIIVIILTIIFYYILDYRHRLH
jgi:hypothetical protein